MTPGASAPGRLIGRRVLDRDPLSGVTRYWSWDPEQQASVIETVHDVTPILEHNKALQARTDERAGWKGNWHRVAAIPLSLYFALKQKGITKDRKALRKWLNDPDNRLFRTRTGRV